MSDQAVADPNEVELFDGEFASYRVYKDGSVSISGAKMSWDDFVVFQAEIKRVAELASKYADQIQVNQED